VPASFVDNFGVRFQPFFKRLKSAGVISSPAFFGIRSTLAGP
jgi:hypothetical protein